MPRNADKPLAKMLQECLLSYLHHLHANPHINPKNASGSCPAYARPFRTTTQISQNALQPGQHVRAPCPGWARRPADKPTQQCAYAKICPDVSDDSHKTCGVWSCAQMWQECFGTLLGYLHLLAHMYKYPKNVADGPPANEPKNVPRNADKPLAKMLPECLTLHLQHLLAHSHKYPRNALHPTDYIWS